MEHALFVFSKLVYFFIRVDTLLLLLVAGSIWARRAGDITLSRRLTWLVFGLFLVLGFLPVSRWIMGPLENAFSRPSNLSEVHGVLVLGGGIDDSISEERNRLELNSSGDRIFAIWGISKKWPEASIYYLGGSGRVLNPQRSESNLVERHFQFYVLPELHYERESRNTVENAQRALEMIQPEEGQNWLLVTSAFHMPRAMGVFQKQGWKVLPYPVDYRTSLDLFPGLFLGIGDQIENINLALKEWAGLLAYRLLGRTSELFPQEK